MWVIVIDTLGFVTCHIPEDHKEIYERDEEEVAVDNFSPNQDDIF
jgi:hypothetical protein